MEWQVTYNGKAEMLGIEISSNHKPDLLDQVIASSKEIRKGDHGHETYRMRVQPDAIQAHPEEGGTAIYHPIGNVVYVTQKPHSIKGVRRNTYLVAFVVTDGESPIGSSTCKYYCHTFKMAKQEDGRDLAFAISRTMKTHEARRKTLKQFSSMDRDEIDDAVRWWNAHRTPLFQLNVDKQGAVSGAMRLSCQVDPSVKDVQSKAVRITSNMCGEPLVAMLSDKFNLGNVDYNDYAVFVVKVELPDPVMLEDEESPIAMALGWDSPVDGTFILKKLPKGLRRIREPRPAPTNESGDTVSHSSPSGADPASRGSSPRSPGAADSVLGPVLPYNEQDEDLLLSVMITRQSGTGLGFKLTPSYLLQMCTAYCATRRGVAALRQLLGKLGKHIRTIVESNPKNPELLLFWVCNSLKLARCFERRQDVRDAYAEVAKANLDAATNTALESIMACISSGMVAPQPLLDADSWSTADELRDVITTYYERLDATMSKENLQEVVDRITAAMPSPHPNSAVQSAPRSGSRLDKAEKPPALNLDGVTTTSATADQPMTSTPGNGSGGGAGADEPVTEPARERPGIDPLPEEWEELTDQETKHRFFANHLTRQTSWTDPRDKLRTVTLTKGATGLGLGISGAKRTWDDRLILGIFVSSLVSNSAAAEEGTLREGDEILEVNGHSLIGVSRDGAIEFLKQVLLGDSVTLLVAQEPEVWVNPANERAALRHTAL